MKRSLFWSIVLLFLFVASPFLARQGLAEEEKGNKPSNQEALLLMRVMQYLDGVRVRTTLQNDKLSKELVGATFKGEFILEDVYEPAHPQGIIRIKGNACDPDSFLQFDVSDPEMKKKAAELKKASVILITAKLKYFSRQDSRYLGSSGWDYAAFEDVQILKVQPYKDICEELEKIQNKQ